MNTRLAVSRLGVGILLGAFLVPPSYSSLLPDHPAKKRILKLNAEADFRHGVGKKGARGWELDYKKHRPGYALKGLHDPLQLEPGIYRMTFVLRRGHYPKKGILYKTNSLFRLEIWDLTANELINDRELQFADFPNANRYHPRRLEFTMEGRKGHLIEPRIYWIGLANGEIDEIRIDKFSDPDLKELEDKAFRLGKRLENNHLENGFVVSRKPDGTPDETGDATTYTGFYVCSLAWKYAVTKDALTLQALENGLQTLHKSIKGTADFPMLTRFVEEDGTPHPKSPSKDVFTSFFLAYSVAYPHIQNKALKKQIEDDLIMVADRFLQDGLTVKKGEQILMSLTPYFTEAEIRSGIRKLFKKKDGTKKILKGLKQAKSYLPFTELWPGIKKVKKAFKKKDEDELIRQVVPSLNGIANLAERVRNVLKEQYRTDLFPKRFRNKDYPGKRLEILLTEALNKFPPQKRRPLKPKQRFWELSDFSILGSNALIALHIVKTAEKITEQPQFQEYYKNNLYAQDALLKTALDWYGFEEDFTVLTSGNPAADRLRKGYLSTLSLYNLIQHESNKSIRERYKSILKRWWETYKNEDNPFAQAIVEACLSEKDSYKTGLILRGLALYPENQTGFGEVYWKKHGEYIATNFGGGIKKKYSLEPIPISHRPKGSFLWQRNARRLRGDFLKEYPGTDYLFVYWFSRYHGLIPSTPVEPSVSK